jgi:hypothetical protein
MERIKTLAGLRAAIAGLEARQEEQSMQLRYQADLAIESLKPVNLIKSAISEVVGPSNIKANLLSNSLGFGAGFISKILIEGVMRRPLNRLIGTAIMFGIQSLISKSPDTIRTIGAGVFGLFRRKSREKLTEPDQNN